MNLMKLFNVNYFKENLKKSKGLLAFFLGLVPLLNVIMLILIKINNSDVVLMEFDNLSIITFLGMYIIPIVLACSLIGFVFKRKSVDFVLSKPVNRKSIFITSLIGGIFLILIYMLLNSLIFLIFNLVGNIIIPFPLIIDYFLYYLIGYIFMFAVAMLAISISGNLISSLIVLVIILCLVPFLMATKLVFDTKYNNNYVTSSTINAPNYSCNIENCYAHLNKNEYYLNYNKTLNYTFTAPLMFLNNGNITYNSKSIIKMSILIILYSLIAYYLFQKRKMENNETSFKNETLHYLIKGITLIPVSFIAYIIMTEIDFPTNIIICIVAILIYQTIYDLITRKEIYKLKKSLVITTFSCIAFICLFNIYDQIDKTQVINLDDITSFIVPAYVSNQNGYYYTKKYYDIKDKELINNIINATLESNDYSTSALVTINNKVYRFYIYDQDYRDQISLAYKNAYLKDFANTKINKIIYATDLKLTKELKNILSETLKQSNLNIANYHQELLTIYKYQNHEYKSLAIPYNLNQKLDQYVLKERNTKNATILDHSNDVLFSIYNPSSKLFDDIDLQVFSYVLNNSHSELINYITKENNIFTDNVIEIGFNNFDESGSILIGDALKFKEEFEKWQTKLSKTKDYQELFAKYEEGTK